MTHDLLTITGIAQKLGMPESTVRYYRNKFPDFIPAVGEGRKRKYRPETLEVIAIIEKMFRENRTALEIAERLANKFPQNIDLENQPQQVIATTPQPQIVSSDVINVVAGQTHALKHLALVLDKFYNHERELKTLSDEVIFLRKQLDGLRKNNKYDRELETLSDEVIFLRKKLGNGHNGNNGHSHNNNGNGLNRKFEEVLKYLKQLEEKQVETQFNLVIKERRLREIEKKFSKARRPWWARWLSL